MTTKRLITEATLDNRGLDSILSELRSALAGQALTITKHPGHTPNMTLLGEARSRALTNLAADLLRLEEQHGLQMSRLYDTYMHLS